MAERVPDPIKKEREEINKTKWVDLVKRGFTKPRNEAEREKRLKEAHHAESE